MCIHCKEAFDLLEAKFGEEHAKMLLWGATCFPMDGEIALRQAKQLVRFKTAKEAYDFAWSPEFDTEEARKGL